MPYEHTTQNVNHQIADKVSEKPGEVINKHAHTHNRHALSNFFLNFFIFYLFFW